MTRKPVPPRVPLAKDFKIDPLKKSMKEMSIHPETFYQANA